MTGFWPQQMRWFQGIVMRGRRGLKLLCFLSNTLSFSHSGAIFVTGLILESFRYLSIGH